jgi:hypothetical protein
MLNMGAAHIQQMNEQEGTVSSERQVVRIRKDGFLHISWHRSNDILSLYSIIRTINLKTSTDQSSLRFGTYDA